MADKKFIEKVAIVGAGGRIGKHFAEALLKTGKHTVTAITRAESKGGFPTGVKAVQVDYDNESSIVSAIQGQDILIITLSVFAPPDTHSKLVKAGIKAGVPYIMPNAYGYDVFDNGLAKDKLIGAPFVEKVEEIGKLGGTSLIMVCGFWYEWSLALGEPWFGFDIKNRHATFFDDGNTKIGVSTWDQCGRALAAMLSFPESGASPSVSDWKNKAFFFSSFRLSQRDMLDSLHRVLGTSDKDWTIVHDPTAERYKNGVAAMQKGDRHGYARAMYSRVFFPDGGGDFESAKGVSNDLLGLPKEDLDFCTKRAVDMVESGWNPFA